MEQTLTQIQQQTIINPYTYDEIFEAVNKAVERAGWMAFKAFLNDYKIIPETQSYAA